MSDEVNNLEDAEAFIHKGDSNDDLHEQIDHIHEETSALLLSAKTEVERRVLMQDNLKAIFHACFMSHHGATEEDFENYWPGIREEYFRKCTLETFLGVSNERAGKQSHPQN